MGDSLEHLSALDCYTWVLPGSPALTAIRPESIIYKNHSLSYIDDYVGALPCLHCRDEKGKPGLRIPNIRKKHVKTSHHTKFWSHWKLVPSHHFGVNIYLFQHICLITPFDVWSDHLEYGYLNITCDQTVNCWSHHKTCSSHHRHFVHTIRCASHHIPCVTTRGAGSEREGAGYNNY